MIRIGGNATNITLSGNRETCPRCNALAITAEGVFSSVDNTLKLISGPDVTVQLLSKFADLLQKARADNIPGDELEKKADALDERLGDVVRSAKRQPSLMWTILLVVVLVLHACEFKIEAKVDLNNLLDQVMSRSKDRVIDGWTTSVQVEHAERKKGRRDTKPAGGRTDPKSKK